MGDPLNLAVRRMETPIGDLVIVTDGAGALRAVDWSDYEHRMMRLLHRQYGRRGFRLAALGGPTPVDAALGAYFRGALDAIDGIEVATGGTVFQRRVWAELRTIPCGTTISYRELAARIGSPAAIRAVGLANGANPVGIVVPCHRVIGSNGTLTGYGGGIGRKRWLLLHEGVARAGLDGGRGAKAAIPEGVGGGR